MASINKEIDISYNYYFIDVKDINPDSSEDITPYSSEDITPYSREDITPYPREDTTPDPKEDITPEPKEDTTLDPKEDTTLDLSNNKYYLDWMKYRTKNHIFPLDNNKSKFSHTSRSRNVKTPLVLYKEPPNIAYERSRTTSPYAIFNKRVYKSKEEYDGFKMIYFVPIALSFIPLVVLLSIRTANDSDSSCPECVEKVV